MRADIENTLKEFRVSTFGWKKRIEKFESLLRQFVQDTTTQRIALTSHSLNKVLRFSTQSAHFHS